MKNYLEKLCISLGIKLTYVNNKVMLLSSDLKGNVPIIRAHKVFKNCTEDIASAVLGYYTGSGKEKEYEIIIRGYIEQVLPGVSYKIKDPIEGFKGSVVDTMPVKNYSENEEQELVEFGIAYISIIEPSGKEKIVNPKESIHLLEDKVLEMDIVVSPPLT